MEEGININREHSVSGTTAVVNDSLPSAGRKWFVLYTRSRHEKFVESALMRKGIESFVPTVFLRRRWSDRIKIIREPIFKGYCFARFSLEDKAKVVSQQGVVDVVHFKGQYIPVQESVIDSLKILVENKVRIDPYPYLKNGDIVRVVRGPLKDVEGYIVEKRKKDTTLVISVDAVALSIKCIVDVADIEPA